MFKNFPGKFPCVCIDFERICRICRKKSKTGSVKRQQESRAFPRCIRGVNHKDKFYDPGATVRHGDVERRPDKAATRSCVSLLLDSWVVGKDSIVGGKE